MTHLRPRLVPLMLLLLVAAVPARAEVSQPRLVKVALSQRVPLRSLLEAGLDVIEVHGTTEARILEWPGDEETLNRIGALHEVVDENPGRTAALRNQAELARIPIRRTPVRSAIGQDGRFETNLLPPFGQGSMGGFWTRNEIKMKLDSLVANDPHGVVADKVDTMGYSRRWPVWGLKLGKQVEGPDTRPLAFFNSLTHAREPEGMQALFYFVDDLLSKYGTDPWATYLLDHRQIYICPLVNPDGYEINENTYTSSGSFGMWRKNTRDNNGNNVFESSTDGVDLNRNFGYRWGKDDTGSSPTQSAETYRGPFKWSEPETRVQRDKVAAFTPVTGLSFHTYQDLMIHPWGHTDSLTQHNEAFHEWSDELTRDNAYQSGPSPHTLYSVNGEFNDWCYGDTLLKPRVFSWTPEVGSDNDGFWPPPSRIVPLAQENIRTCYVIAALAGPWVQEDGVSIPDDGALEIGYTSILSVRARNLGITGQAGPNLSGTLTALDAGVHVTLPTIAYPTLGTRQSGDPVDGAVFWLTVDDTVTAGRLLHFRVAFTTPDGFYSEDTFAVPAGVPTTLFADDASSGTGLWNIVPTSWGIVSNDATHPSRYFADSPAGNYVAGANSKLIKKSSLDLSHGVHSYALYEAKWEFEKNYDLGSLEASLDSVTWTLVSATGSTPGSGLSPQPSGLPVYAGVRWYWKSEIADLSPWTGPGRTTVRLRFRTLSDGGSNFDGFDFDSLRIVTFDPAAQPGPAAVGDPTAPRALALEAPSPNPARNFMRFRFAIPVAGPVRLDVFDVQGRRVATLASGNLAAREYERGWDLRDATGRRVRPGLYLARIAGPSGSATQRFAVID